MKKLKKSFVLLAISILLLGTVPSSVIGSRYRYDYETASQKIFEEIHTFTFVFSSTTLNYSIFFGAMYIKLNNTHSEIVSDVFVVTLTSQYVTMLTATLTFDANFSYAGTWNNHSGVGVDSTSIVEFDDLLYNYSIHSFLITNDLFPLELEITFDYALTSSEFSESGTYNVVKTFTMPSPERGIPGYILSISISVLVVGFLTIALIFKKKRIL